jgi:hypothetical protein
LSADAPPPFPLDTGLTPLSSGPLPLSRRAAIWAAAAVFLGTLCIGVGLPLLASRVAEVRVPPGAIAFGNASIIPAAGWSQAERSATSVTLEKSGVWITFQWLQAPGQTAAQRVHLLAAEMQAEFPQLAGTSEPVAFSTPTKDVGQLIALASATQTSLVASVVDKGEAVDVQSLGDALQFGEVISEAQGMIESIRLLGPGHG